jgi:RNA 3'-terminal phosphate cyclase
VKAVHSVEWKAVHSAGLSVVLWASTTVACLAEMLAAHSVARTVSETAAQTAVAWVELSAKSLVVAMADH